MSRRLLAAVGIVLVQFFLISCAHRPARMSYQLQQQSGDSVLVPPESGRWQPGEVLHFHLRRKRGARDCATPAGILQLSLHRSSAALTADFKDVVIDGRLRLDALRDIDRFRSGLHQLEAQGCLPAGGPDLILRRLQESIATPPAVAVFLRYGIYPVNGAMDLIPGMRLKQVAPMRDTLGTVAGYETTWYDIKPSPDGGVMLEPTRAPEDAPRNAKKLGLRAAPVELSFPPAAHFLRLLLRLSISPADHPILFLGGADQDAIDTATAKLRQRPFLCPTMSGKAWCHPVPYGAALTAEINVRVGRKTVYVPLDATVAEALETAGHKHSEQLLPRLQVWRVYQGTHIPIVWDRHRAGLLELRLMGGDEIRW